MNGLALSHVGVRQHGLVYKALSQLKTIEVLYLTSKLIENNFVWFEKVRHEMQNQKETMQWKLLSDFR
jgi:hypothetical protein